MFFVVFYLGDHNSTAEEEANDNPNKCSNRAQKWSRGIILTLIISFSWVGTFHLIRLCYERGSARSATIISTHPSNTDNHNRLINYINNETATISPSKESDKVKYTQKFQEKFSHKHCLSIK